jgi:hypothetical protein
MLFLMTYSAGNCITVFQKVDACVLSIFMVHIMMLFSLFLFFPIFYFNSLLESLASV